MTDLFNSLSSQTPEIPEEGREGKEKLTKKVLIADDDDSILRMSSRILRGAGYEVETVSNGNELLEKLFQQEYDLVITDNTMPVMKGIDALAQIRADERFRNLPVILNSSNRDDIQQRTLALGAVFLAKPFSGDSMLSIVRNLIEEK